METECGERSQLAVLKRRVEQLEGDSRLLRSMYRDTNQALACFDVDLRYVHVNASLARLNGISIEAHLGKRIGDVLPAVAKAVESSLQQVLDTGEPLIAGRASIATPASGGQLREFEHSYYPNMAPDGSLIGVSCVIDDVTDFVRVEGMHLALSELLDLLPYGVQVNDTEGVVTYSNLAHARIHGKSEGELIGLSIFELVEPQVRPALREYFAVLVSQQPDPSPHESTGRRPDGTVFHQHVDWAYQRDSDGRLIGFISIVTDITEQVRMREALEKSETGLRQAQAIATLGSWEWNIQTGGTEWSDEMYRIYGQKPGAFQPGGAGSLLSPIHEADRERVERFVDRTLETEGVFQTEYRAIRPDSEISYIHAIAEAVRDPSGKPVALRGTAQDTGKFREAESQKLRARELDHRVKNNLATILGFIGITAAGSDNLDIFVETFTARIRKMAEVHDALAAHAWQNVSLREVVELSTRDIVTDLPSSDRELPADAALPLGLALHELSTNAIKYGCATSPEGRVHLSWEVDRDTGCLVVRWTESGGAPPATDSKIGVGLSLVTALVEHEVGGAVTFAFPPSGAQHELQIPGRHDADTSAGG